MNAGGKITVAKAPLPPTYLEAKQALAKCVKVDECASWADKALALASYGKQAGDKALENMAQKILDRAIQRGGELLLEVEASKGGRPSKTKVGGGPSSMTRKALAEEAGISERQAKDMVRVARVPFEQFESLVESDDPATVTELAELGTKKREKEPRNPLLDPHLDWRYAIKKLVAVPSCGLDAMAAFMRSGNEENLEECKLALANLKAWQKALEKVM